MSHDCKGRKYSNNKKIDKAEKVIDGDDDDLVLCLLMIKNKKENAKKKVQFAKDGKQPSKAGMMCTIDGDSFYSFGKNTWIGDSIASCNITNNDSGMFNIIQINMSIQGSSSIMLDMKKGK